MVNLKKTPIKAWYTFLCITFALIFLIIPWESLLNKVYFSDRATNKLIIDNGFSKLNYFERYYSDFFGYISNEYGWEVVLYYLKFILNLDSHFIFNFLAFFSFSLSCIFVALRSRFIYILLLLNPWFFDFFYSQSRLAFAISLLYCCYMLRKKIIISLPLLIFLLTVHSSIAIFIFILSIPIVLNVLTNKLILKIFFLNAVGFLVALLTGPFFIEILLYFGDRRSEVYENLDMSSSVVDVILWIMLYFYYIFGCYSKRIIMDYNAMILIIILSIVFFNTVLFEGYVTRFLVALYPILIVSLVRNIKDKGVLIFIFVYCFYIFIGWFFRFFILWR